MRVAYRPFFGTVDQAQEIDARLAHPMFAFMGIRPIASQHSRAEDNVLRKYAALAQKVIVEIGVAEGASALSMRESMPSSACLFLVDPFQPGSIPFLSAMFLVAQKGVNSIKNGSVVWIRDLSFNAVKSWDKTRSIDLLFIDGDHSEQGCMQDWTDWSPLVSVGGHVIFHDARLFPGGWPRDCDGPVKVVNRLFRDQEASPQQWQIVEELNSIVVVKKLA
jgi:predicted O-methyltransferase YrrM